MEEELTAALKRAAKKAVGYEGSVELSRPPGGFGDFSTNLPLTLAAASGQSARDLAARLADILKSDRGVAAALASVEVAGPGFINLRLSDSVLWRAATANPAQFLRGQVVVAEYSDPNPFKILHAGHLYTTVVGDVIARLLETAGARLYRLNYGGDVGRHVGMAMWAILRQLGGEYPEKLKSISAKQRLQWLSDRYVEGNAAYENEATAKSQIQQINQRVYRLHAENDHHSAFGRIYWTARAWSYDGFKRLYKDLMITPFDEYIAESEVVESGLKIVKEGLARGIFEQSDGAVIFRGEPHGLHARVFITAAGLPTYEAKELGLAVKKWQDYRFDQNIIITANDILEYMKVVEKALSYFYPEIAARNRHLTHGVVKLPGGLKMSSRKGSILSADDILDAANVAAEDLSGAARQEVVLAAVKYAFLKQRLGGDIIYDPDESVALEGNSGPYLQYAHARARSILAKVAAGTTQDDEPDVNFEAGERQLVAKLGQYAEVVGRASKELAPHHLCAYLYELAQTFNRFYEQNRVAGDDRQALRLRLVKLYAERLRSGLALLGITAIDKM